MKRATYYLLLTCFAFAALQTGAKAFGAPLPAPSGFASQYFDRDIEKYNRKLNNLEVKRVRDQQKLEADYLKLVQRKKKMDLRKLQQEMDKFQRKRDKVEEKYRREIEKLERKERGGGKAWDHGLISAGRPAPGPVVGQTRLHQKTGQDAQPRSGGPTSCFSERITRANGPYARWVVSLPPGTL